MHKIRIGVLGVSGIAQKAILPNLNKLTDFYEIVGVASRNIEKVQPLIEVYQIKAFEGYESILDKKYIDAIYIPLPNALHYHYVKLALKQGIHVLVEKSLACNFKEVKELVELANKNDLALMENFQFRFHSQLLYLREMIATNQIGDIRSLRASFGFPPLQESDNIRYQKTLGGGALLDAGAYTTKIAHILLGKGLEVKAAVLNTSKDHEVDIWGNAFLEHQPMGVCASLAFGFDHHYQCGVEIWGSKGKISTNRLFTAPEGYEPTFVVETSKGIDNIRRPSDNHFKNMLMHFYNCTQQKDLKTVENQQNLEQARLIEEINLKANE
jgi:NDP-hexose-3-ketoreductase